MIENFNRAVAFVLREEGGLSNERSDPGGLTKFGISTKRYPNVDMASLMVEQAKEIYHRDYWQVSRCGDLPWPLCCVQLDASVNLGDRQAGKLLQRALGITEDGVIGAATISSALSAEPVLLSLSVIQARRTFYKNLVNNRPLSMRFLAGWLNRCDALEYYIK